MVGVLDTALSKIIGCQLSFRRTSLKLKARVRIGGCCPMGMWLYDPNGTYRLPQTRRLAPTVTSRDQIVKSAKYRARTAQTCRKQD